MIQNVTSALHSMHRSLAWCSSLCCGVGGYSCWIFQNCSKCYHLMVWGGHTCLAIAEVVMSLFFWAYDSIIVDSLSDLPVHYIVFILILSHSLLAVTFTHITHAHTHTVSHYHWWRQQWAAKTSGEIKTFGWWLPQRKPQRCNPAVQVQQNTCLTFSIPF